MTVADECRSCGAKVIWAVSAKPPAEGETLKRQPLDHAAGHDPGGKLECWRGDDGIVYYLPLRKGQQPAAGHHRATSHYARCPDAAHWRNRSQEGTQDAPTA